MSYRSFKRLFGETSLERKCRFFFGVVTLLLITASFWWYAWNTEDVAYDQAKAMGRVLVYYAALKAEWAKALTKDQLAIEGDLRRDLLPADLRFTEEIIPADTADPEKRDVVQEFLQTGIEEKDRRLSGRRDYSYTYWAPLRNKENGQLASVVEIRMSTKALDNRMPFNRAILITTALVTALLLMWFSWLIVRYVIVKPVKHLKEVSDAIATGELNIRSEIQTGDEFEDLSHAFNRMLRSLVSMQDQLRRVNADLDRKLDELAQANLALFQSNQLKSDFLATMSHELRTPLNSIIGFSEVLLTGGALSDNQRKWVSHIQSGGKQLLTLINDILDLAKMEAGKMQLRIEEFSIHDVCEGLLNMFRPQAAQKNILLEGKIDPGLPVIKQDAGKIQQILQNLLSNAVKFTPEGGRVSLKADTDGMHVILSVIDTGVGITPEDQEVIFEKFRQGNKTLTREYGGTGLGLSIVRELSRLLGGNVAVQSELGRGSTFTVTLPLTLTQEPRLDFDLAKASAGMDGKMFHAPRLENVVPQSESAL
jgi:signal transduction histidine kinase